MPIVKELRASGDTYISTVGADSNFGASGYLAVSHQRGPPPLRLESWTRSLVKFDISGQIPPGSDVSSAVLTLTVKSPPSMGLTVQIYALTKPFRETSATWFTHQSSFGSLLTTGTVTFDHHRGTRVNFDVTSYVRNKVLSGETIYGFFLKCPDSELDGVQFYSREGAPYDSWKPTLKVVYTTSYIDLAISQASLNLTQGGTANVQLSIGGTYNGRAEISHRWVGPAPSGMSVQLTRTSGKVPFASTLQITASDSTPPGQYRLEVRAKNGEGSYNLYDKETINITVRSAQEPDFSLNISPASQNISQGERAEYSIAVSPIAGFSDTVRFSVSGIPPASTYQFLSTGSSIFLRITTTPSTPPGDYNITVTAEGGGKTHTASAILSVTAAQTTSTTTGASSFLISVNPTSLTLTRGGMAHLSVTVQGVGGFSSPVTLSASGLPSGVTISTNVNNAPPDFTADVALVATNDAPLGAHQFTLLATGGGVTRRSTVTLTIQPSQGTQTQTHTQTQTQTQTRTQTRTGTAAGGTFNFSLSVTPTNLILNPGSSGSVAVTVRKLSGSGTVALTASGYPGDTSVTFNPPSLQEGTSSLVIRAGQTTGTFTVVVTGTSGNLRRSATFQLQIKAEESRCIIATAAFGSELAPEVSYLRSFRDGVVMSTYSGSRFMTVFNAFYYPWSPAVAAAVRENGALRGAARLAIYPLLEALKLGSLVYSALPGGDPSMVGVGALVSLVLGLIYLWPLSLLSIRFRRLADLRLLGSAIGLAAASAGLLGLSVAVMWDALAMLSASSLVLSCLSIPPIALSHLLAGRFNRSP